MKFSPIAAALLLAFAPTAALADGHGDHAMDEPKAAALSIDTPVEVLVANAQAKAILVKHMGGNDISLHPMYDQFKAMSLKQLQPFSQGAITEDMLTKIAADLSSL